MLPLRWRDKGTPREFYVIYQEQLNHLCVLSPSAFYELIKSVKDTADKGKVPHRERELSKRVVEVKLDKVGRLQLSANLLEMAGIKDQGLLVGRFDKFELSAPLQERPKSQAEVQAAEDVEKLLEDL